MKWWAEAERRAGLERVERRGWHSCRRAFVTELFEQGESDETINALGGWSRGSNIPRRVYQQSQLDHQRTALRRRHGWAEQERAQERAQP